MDDPTELEAHFEKYITDLKGFLPDGVIEVDLELLQELDLLHVEKEEEDNSALSQSFYVIESPEKLTLFNEQYAVWIVPELIKEIPTTYTLIALNHADQPHLEMAFSTSGVYNHSGLVLRILEKFLDQIDENEEEIIKLDT
ncbi:MAG: hypothetical protein S4CHLAM45_12710 [Chlamydiales bacterium]|nr:hypothetical protein [Chlamydiales bacterium]MCH9619760.1 hypothetical protein [Chlamydiales bacterium]MCH9623366.1 hypothetical protein [Chlamydiales bacterium]